MTNKTDHDQAFPSKENNNPVKFSSMVGLNKVSNKTLIVTGTKPLRSIDNGNTLIEFTPDNTGYVNYLNNIWIMNKANSILISHLDIGKSIFIIVTFSS